MRVGYKMSQKLTAWFYNIAEIYILLPPLECDTPQVDVIRLRYFCELLIYYNGFKVRKFIPEQFTAIGPPSFIWRGEGRGEGQKKLWWHTFQRLRPEEFRPEIPPEISAWWVFFGRRFTVKAHSTNTYTNTNTNTDLPILKILRFVNFGRKLLRPKPLESVPQFFKNHFCPKASAHRSRSPHKDVLATDSGQPYAGEWRNCLRIQRH